MVGRKAIGAAASAAILLAGAAAAGQVPRPSRATTLRGNPGQFFGPDNYPPEAVRNHEQGRTVAKLEVGPDGRVTACTVAASSGSASLDQATCDIALARVTFTPAVDETGRPIASTYTLPVRWVLPGGAVDVAQEPLDRVIEVKVAVEPGGKIVSCTATSMPPLSPPLQPCARYPVGTIADGLQLTRNGRPIGATVTQTMRQQITLDP